MRSTYPGAELSVLMFICKKTAAAEKGKQHKSMKNIPEMKSDTFQVY